MRLLLLLLAPLFLCIASALVCAFERISNALFTAQTGRFERVLTFYGPTKTGASPSDYEYIDVDININVAPPLACLAVAVFAFVVSFVDGCGIWELRRMTGSERHQRRWSWILLVVNALVVGVSVGVLAWTGVVQGQEGWRGYEDVVREDQRWTRETWVCQIDHFFPKQDWAGSACGLSKATRLMLIAVAVAAVLVMGTAWTLVHQRGGAAWLFGGNGRYGGFANVYEMGPGAVPSVYPQAPVYSHGPGPVYTQGPVYSQAPVYPQSPGYQPQAPWPGYQPQAPAQVPIHPQSPTPKNQVVVNATFR